MLTRAICFIAVAAIFTASSVEAQSFRTLGTRRGALIGGIIGGVIGGQNDEVAAGIIAGGLVGGITGRVIGNRMDGDFRQAYNQGYAQGYYQPAYQPAYQPPVRYSVPSVSQPHFGHPVQSQFVQPHFNSGPVIVQPHVPIQQPVIMPQGQGTFYHAPQSFHYPNGW